MTVQAPMDFVVFQNAIQAWFATATELTTVWADQSAPQPAYPFANLSVLNPPKEESAHWTTTYTDVVDPDPGEEIEIKTSAGGEIIVSCQVYVGMPNARNPAADAGFYLSAALAALSLSTVNSTLNDAFVSIVRKGRPQNINALIADARVSRAVADVTFSTPLNVVELVGYFATVQLVSEDLGIDETVPLQ